MFSASPTLASALLLHQAAVLQSMVQRTLLWHQLCARFATASLKGAAAAGSTSEQILPLVRSMMACHAPRFNATTFLLADAVYMSPSLLTTGMFS